MNSEFNAWIEKEISEVKDEIAKSQAWVNQHYDHGLWGKALREEQTRLKWLEYIKVNIQHPPQDVTFKVGDRVRETLFLVTGTVKEVSADGLYIIEWDDTEWAIRPAPGTWLMKIEPESEEA